MLRHLRSVIIRSQVEDRKSFYDLQFTREQQLAEQLKHFNQCWERFRSSVPFYRDLAQRLQLPLRFRCWEEVIEKLPIIDRAAVQEYGTRLYDPSKPPDFFRSSGGSSGQPVRLPGWHSEVAFTTPDLWLARSWYGITPSDRLFLIWGHSHLLGTGWSGIYKKYKRLFKDWLIGCYRYSAYGLDEAKMRQAAEALIRFRPDYVVGYSKTLDALARYNKGKKEKFHLLKIKAVIGAAEAFPFSDSADLIAEVFGSPVGMEYGSAETNLMAHTHPAGGYRVFWRTHFIEALDKGPSGGRVVRVTSLFPRCFPLIRYEIGDEVEIYEDDEPAFGLRRIKSVIGRCWDSVVLRSGRVVSSLVFSAAVRPCAKITALQVVQEGENILLTVKATSELTPEDISGIQYRLGKCEPELANTPVKRVTAFEETIAGKTPTVVKRDRSL